jgi:hypothetical protein
MNKDTKMKCATPLKMQIAENVWAKAEGVAQFKKPHPRLS